MACVKRFHDARWPGRVVGRWRDLRRARREERRLRELAQAGLPVPEVLGVRETPDGVELRTRWIAGARTVAELLEDPSGIPDRLAAELGRLLGALHRAGFEHGDLHPGNVVIDAEQRAWLVDAAAIRPTRGAPWLDLVKAAAHAREVTTARFRARFLVAYLRDAPRVLSDAPRVLSDAPRVLSDAPRILSDAPRVLSDAPRILSDAPPMLRDDPRLFAVGLEVVARQERRRSVEAEGDRWLRESGVCALHQDGEFTVLVPHAVERDATLALVRHAVDGDALNGVEVARDVQARAAWICATRLVEHRVPVLRPLALVVKPRPLALFALPEGARDVDARCRADAQALGTLAGTLSDRGLSLGRTVVVLDGQGTAYADPRCALEAPHVLGEGLAAWQALAPAADRAMRLRFAAAFLRAHRGSRLERGELRRRLCRG